MSKVKNLIMSLVRGMRPRDRIRSVSVPVLESELLKGRVAVVTGGTSGIGFAIARRFLESGARVIITGRVRDRVSLACEKLKQYGASVRGVVLDNGAIESFADFVKQIGSFDILVNNAGYVGGEGFGATSVNEYDKVLDTNLRGAYFLSQEVSNVWIKTGVMGNILNICSASSMRPGNSPYILSKWGLRSLTIGMAKTLIKHGIVVNGLAPGCTNTEQFSRDGYIENQKNPSGRMVTTEEVANLAVVMVSSIARMVVGDILYVTGGGAITTIDD